jgi:hypothetical protein
LSLLLVVQPKRNGKKQKLLPYRRAHFTPPGVKYLILDDFHFRIDPQIINYNGLSFHTSMGLPELGWATARRASRQAPVHGHGLAAQGAAHTLKL